MSSTHYDDEEDSNDEVLYGPTDQEDTDATLTSTEKLLCRKRSGTESDSTPSKKNTKVFIAEHLGQSKSKEEDTDAYTSSGSTIKHWRKNFRPRVSHQPITSALRKSGYISGKPKQDTTKESAKLPEPTDYYSDESCSTINYLRDHHTPSGLIDHDYIWQAKQQEVAEINSKGPATTDATTHQLERYKAITHNVQPLPEAIYEQRFGYLVQGHTNYLIFRKSLPTGDRYTYFTETTFIKYSGTHCTVQPYRVSSQVANNFNREAHNLKYGIAIDIYATWRISTIRNDCSYAKAYSMSAVQTPRY